MRVPDNVLKCVVYIGEEIQTADDLSFRFGGTAFMASVPFSNGSIYRHTYIVTAKHVVDQLRGRPLVLRVNLKGGKAGIIRLSTMTPWFFYPSSQGVSDVAVLPFEFTGTSVLDFDFTHVGTEMFLSDALISTARIGPGDEVFITGLFSKMEGTARNLPIVRMGNLAMMPDDPISNVRIGDGRGDMNAYLIEARSIGGLSGSPVFVRETTSLPLKHGDGTKNELCGTGRYYLLGLVHGHWEIADSQRNSVQLIMRSRDEGSVNLGIAVVVPAKADLGDVEPGTVTTIAGCVGRDATERPAN